METNHASTTLSKGSESRPRKELQRELGVQVHRTKLFPQNMIES